MKKTIPILILCIFLLIGFSQTSHAIELLIKEYPTVGGEKLGEQSSIPGLIKYIYLFALGIVGFVALLSMVIGAFQYTTSAGNPTKAGEAKERIMSALLGVLILLSAVLILNTINPDLTSFEIELQKIGQTNNTPNEENDYSGKECYSCKTWGGLLPGCKDRWKLKWCRTDILIPEAESLCKCSFPNKCKLELNPLGCN